MLKILGRASSINVRKVLWVCEELGITYRREDWGEGFKSPQEAAFKSMNPNAMIRDPGRGVYFVGIQRHYSLSG